MSHIHICRDVNVYTTYTHCNTLQHTATDCMYYIYLIVYICMSIIHMCRDINVYTTYTHIVQTFIHILYIHVYKTYCIYIYINTDINVCTAYTHMF